MSQPESPITLVRAALAERAVMAPGAACWLPAPAAGVERMVLDPAGEQLGRVTGFMRIAPGARLDPREQAAGAEILVLAGALADERGQHRAGTYLRNGPGDIHALRSGAGCTLFVKLRQFPAGDLASQVVDTRRVHWSRGRSDPTSVLPLHSFGTERTCLVHWRGGSGGAPIRYPQGAEMLVLDGELADEHGHHPPGTWLRLPGGCWHRPRAGRRGVLTWIKTGHLGTSVRAPGAAPRATEAAA